MDKLKPLLALGLLFLTLMTSDDNFGPLYIIIFPHFLASGAAVLPSSSERKRPTSSEKDNDDAKSVSSVKSSASATTSGSRKTPAQVKAEAAARKAKVSSSGTGPWI
jgi:hypothetical protein